MPRVVHNKITYSKICVRNMNKIHLKIIQGENQKEFVIAPMFQLKPFNYELGCCKNNGFLNM
ncbi:hypothetical protein HN51_062309 [Arachis hypogaea]